jgi:hypothetical protein
MVRRRAQPVKLRVPYREHRRLVVIDVCSLVLVCALLSGCAGLGYTSRVRIRAASPDGQLIAVCQEVPVFDGPNFEVRLERPDGTRLHRVLQSGDGDPCDEIAWSPDGRGFAMLSSHVARIMLVDVGRALELKDKGAAWDWSRQVTLAINAGPAANLRFDGPASVEFDLCVATEQDPKTGVNRCAGPSRHQRLELEPKKKN